MTKTRNMRISCRSLAAVLAASMAMPGLAGAQSAWPAAKPVTMIVPFAAGGPTDVIARRYAEFISRDIGQSVVVENVAGAGGTTGSARAAKAAPDGYTIQIGQAGTHVSAVGLYKKLPYDPVNDYEHLGLAGDLPQVLIVKKDLPVNSFKAFVDYIKTNGEKMNIGTAGPGSSSHMGASMLNLRLGSKAALVQYRGTGPAMNDLVAGQIEAMVEVSLTATPQIQAGTVKPLAVFRTARVASLPNVPSTDEFGVPGLDFAVWAGFLAPKGTPKDIVDKLNASIRKANADKNLRDSMTPLGVEAPDDANNTPAGFRDFVKAEIDPWVPLMRSAGMQLN